MATREQEFGSDGLAEASELGPDVGGAESSGALGSNAEATGSSGTVKGEDVVEQDQQRGQWDRPPRRPGVNPTAQILTELMADIGVREDGHCNFCPEGAPDPTLCPHACHNVKKYLETGNFGL